MAVIDAHAHLGPCSVFDLNISEEELLQTLDQNGIQAALVQPFPGVANAIEIHNQIATLSKKHPGRVFGVCNVNPRLMGKDEYFAEAERCVKQLGFVALKLHTIGHAVNPISEVGGWVFEAAHLLGVPIHVHTGTGIPFALPGACIPRAMQYPKLPIVLIHSGWVLVSPDAYAAAKICPNIYLETSWSIGAEIQWWAHELGAHRVMMGADLPNNRAAEIAKYHALSLSDKQLEQVLGGTVADLHQLAVAGR